MRLSSFTYSWHPFTAILVIKLVNAFIQGATVPLVVKWADTEKERQARRAQKSLSHASDSRQHPSLFGALPMGYMPPYNGYGYQVHWLAFSSKFGFQAYCFVFCSEYSFLYFFSTFLILVFSFLLQKFYLNWHAALLQIPAIITIFNVNWDDHLP